jgi:hypothetical protein
VPRYDVECKTHGTTEILRRFNDDTPFFCEAEVWSIGGASFLCAGPVKQVFSPIHARIDDAENAGAERLAKGDPTGKYNLGLPGVYTELGRDATGKMRYDYRPRASSEVSSNAKAREIAREAGLTMADGGRYRSTR